MKVKQLEWRAPCPEQNWCWAAHNLVDYSISHEDCRYYGTCEGYKIGGDDQDIGEFRSLEEAKAACQADFERRVLSCLEEGE